jgi:hypothetical protein
MKKKSHRREIEEEQNEEEMKRMSWGRFDEEKLKKSN